MMVDLTGKLKSMVIQHTHVRKRLIIKTCDSRDSSSLDKDIPSVLVEVVEIEGNQ